MERTKGRGRGDAFLRHATRAKALVLVVDCSRPDVCTTARMLLHELEAYERGCLTSKPLLVVANKMDTGGAATLEKLHQLEDLFTQNKEERLGTYVGQSAGMQVIPFSCRAPGAARHVLAAALSRVLKT